MEENIGGRHCEVEFEVIKNKKVSRERIKHTQERGYGPFRD